jgi:hypothetical protein
MVSYIDNIDFRYGGFVNAHSSSRATDIAEYLLNLMLMLLLLGAAAEVVFTSIALARGGNTLHSLTLPVHAQLPLDQNPPLPPGIRLSHDPTATVSVSDPTATQLLLATGAAVGPFLLLAGALWLLRGLARSVKKGDPFGLTNVQRLRRLGGLLVVGAPLVQLVNWALHSSLANTLPAPLSVSTPGFNFPFVEVLAGLGAFVLAEVFAHATRLQDDVEATI